MFAWLAARRLRKQRSSLERLHLRLLEEARDRQRNGDIRGFADRTEAAEAVSRQLDALTASKLAPIASPRPPLDG